ncbi:hypothetical protein Syun_014626 [Stephania yunnanensis]|uniref:Uncharacterized protein n=1 Tax=Stephania yunnanensis TaxID=152371 RepID=A0AAP0PC43_9MAGN
MLPHSRHRFASHSAHLPPSASHAQLALTPLTVTTLTHRLHRHRTPLLCLSATPYARTATASTLTLSLSPAAPRLLLLALSPDFAAAAFSCLPEFFAFLARSRASPASPLMRLSRFAMRSRPLATGHALTATHARQLRFTGDAHAPSPRAHASRLTTDPRLSRSLLSESLVPHSISTFHIPLHSQLPFKPISCII